MSLQGVISRANNIWLPPPDLSVSEWADEFRRLPPEASAEPGYWTTSRAPYQEAMMDAVSSRGVERVVMMTAAQIGKTELLLNVIGYFIDKEPSPILMMQPTLEMGEAFSKDRLSTMLRDTPCLHGKVKDPRARDSGNTLLHKTFPGGHITIAGANSPASLASRPIRILLCDEVDRYPVSAGTEGDPLTLAMKRTANFWNRKIVFVSTPTMKGASRIEKEYELSDMSEWEVPCPKCGKYQALDWENVIYRDKTEPVMRCQHCGHEGSNSEWQAGQYMGRWNASNPDSSIRGFHVNALSSPWVTWSEIVRQYVEAENKGVEALKVWRNTVLGLPWEDMTGTLEPESLDLHREEYPAEVPGGVFVLTAGVDVQDDRLECEILGHGRRNETWGIEYRVFYGDPGLPELWLELDAYLSRTWRHESGREILVSCVCIDSAGHHTEDVYRYCKPRKRRNIFAIVGRGTFGMPPVSKPSLNNRYHLPLFKLGVSTIKGDLYMRLQAEKGAGGYCHFPFDRENGHRGYDNVYFSGLVSERMVIKRVRGQETVTWEPRKRHIRNEPLDCRVYALGALGIFNPDMERLARKFEGNTQTEKGTPPPAMKKSSGGTRRLMLRRGLRL